ncbi:MAG: gamma subclass chorismate mutase AroQ [Pseudomonadota bacterium]
MMRHLLAFIILSICLLPAAVFADSAKAPKLIGERLSLMKDVAIYKAQRGLPVEDLAREAVVIDAAVKSAAEHGLEPASTRAFFQAQIDAAKVIQACWIERWEAQGELPADGADLVNEIRPELLRLGDAIVAAIAVNIASEDRNSGAHGLSELLAVECLDSEAGNRIANALSAITLSDR